MEQAAKRQRTCIGCGSQASKGQLRRVVRLSDGAVRFDPTGRIAGRGAYVCSAACLRKAVGSGKLNRALKCSVSKDECESVCQDLEAFLAGAKQDKE